MISDSRDSVRLNDQRSRLAFCCISSAEAANAGIDEDAQSLGGGRHVRALGDGDAAVAHQLGGVLAGQFVLGRARHGDVAGQVPDVAALHVRRPGPAVRVVADASPFDLLDLLEQVEVDAVRVVHHAVAVGARDDPGAELMGLLDGVQGHVARARDQSGHAVQVAAARPQHLAQEERRAVPGGLGAHPRPAPLDALAGQHAGLVAVGDPLVLTEQVADLAGADADVAGRHVRVLADVTVELGHEALAEAHDLLVRASLGVEVGAALAATDRHLGEGVLEHLLEPEELHDPEVHGWMEAQAALVRAEGAVELDPEAPVDVDLTGVVLPRDPEQDLALGLADALDDLAVVELGVLGDHGAEALEDLADGLMEDLFPGVAADHVVVGRFELLVHFSPSHDREAELFPIRWLRGKSSIPPRRGRVPDVTLKVDRRTLDRRGGSRPSHLRQLLHVSTVQ